MNPEERLRIEADRLKRLGDRGPLKVHLGFARYLKLVCGICGDVVVETIPASKVVKRGMWIECGPCVDKQTGEKT